MQHTPPLFSPFHKPTHVNPHAPQLNPICSPPPRWPYRRHPSYSPSPSLDNNLPSIGSIFSPGGSQIRTPKSPMPPCGFTPPLTPRQAPSPMQQAFQFGRRLSTTSPYHPTGSPQVGSALPHVGSALSHVGSVYPAPQSLPRNNVKSEPQADEPYPDHKISLKSYAANSSALPVIGGLNRSVQVKSESQTQSTFFSDARESFGDAEAGGVAIAPTHGSVRLVCFSNPQCKQKTSYHLKPVTASVIKKIRLLTCPFRIARHFNHCPKY